MMLWENTIEISISSEYICRTFLFHYSWLAWPVPQKSPGEKVVTIQRKGWPQCSGMGGHYAAEYALNNQPNDTY